MKIYKCYSDGQKRIINNISFSVSVEDIYQFLSTLVNKQKISHKISGSKQQCPSIQFLAPLCRFDVSVVDFLMRPGRGYRLYRQ